MKTTYLAWKNPSCNGINPDWQEITGREFYTLVNSPNGKDRCFIKLESVSKDDGVIFMEATKSEYRKWRKEKDHSDYIREGNQDKGYQTISYHAFEMEDGCYGEEVIEDADIDIESDFLKTAELELLKEALAELSEDEVALIDFLFLSEKQRVDQDYSDTTGIPRRTVTYRKKAALKKLKTFLEFGLPKSKISSQ